MDRMTAQERSSGDEVIPICDRDAVAPFGWTELLSAYLSWKERTGQRGVWRMFGDWAATCGDWVPGAPVCDENGVVHGVERSSGDGLAKRRQVQDRIDNNDKERNE